MPGEVTLEKLFKDSVFHIPPYQRGYAWEAKHVRELLEDLDALPQGKRHYGGTVVLMPTKDTHPIVDEEGIQMEVMDVVDGQQRLTTSVLVLAAIGDELERMVPGDRRAAGIRSRFVSWRDRSGTEVPRLNAHGEVGSFWQHTVLGLTPVAADAARNASEERLLVAKAVIRGFLEEMKRAAPATYSRALVDLREKIAARWDLSIYRVSDESEVGVIFEVMNDRGKPLTELEKTKNYLMYLDAKLDLEDHELDELVSVHFAEIYRELLRGGLNDAAAEDRLLRSHWVATVSGSFRDSWDGAKTVKGRFGLQGYRGRHRDLLADTTAYVQSLRRAATAFADAAAADGSSFGGLQTTNPTALRESSRRLKSLGLRASMLPLIIGARLEVGVDGDAYRRLVDACELFVARVHEFGGWRSNTARARLASLALSIHAGGPDAVTRVAKELCALARSYVDEAKFRENLSGENGWFFSVTYLLGEYEVGLCGGKYVPMFDSLNKLTIEHVLPQHPRDDCWHGLFDDDAREKYTEDLGNKCLSADIANSAMSDRCYAEKVGSSAETRMCYAKSDLRQERELFDLWPSAWTPSTIEERRAKIVNWAMTRWALPEGTGETTFSDQAEIVDRDEPDDDVIQI